jgi:hypothetical protein
MDFSKIVTTVKRVAAILLALCFVLPLSQCATKQSPDRTSLAVSAGAVVTPSTSSAMRYGFDIAKEGYLDLAAGKVKGAYLLLVVFSVFFLPLACLWLGKPLQTLITLLAAFPSGFFLFFWVFAWSIPKVGGLLATGCWMVLLLASLFNVWELWRDWRKKARSAPGLVLQ